MRAGSRRRLAGTSSALLFTSLLWLHPLLTLRLPHQNDTWIHLRWADPGETHARRLAVVALAGLALRSELAYPLYAILPPLQKLQFPYRFVFLALLLANIGFVIHLNERAWFHWGKVARTVAVALIATQCAIAGHLQWSLYQRGEQMPDRAVFMQGSFG
jgi:hypothetical protein